jgi:signal transduction histidine kinase
LPLKRGEEVFGILSFNFAEAHPWDEAERTFAVALADRAAVAYERARLFEAERAANRIKDEFLGIASHELRTPLTSAKSNIQIASRRLARLRATNADDAAALLPLVLPLGQLLDRSEGALDRLARLVDDLLDVSRIQAGKLELRYQRTDLALLVRDAASEEAAAWPDRDVQLQGVLAQPDAAPVWCQADPDRIRQVVSNYVSNALKYAPPGPPVTVLLTVADGVTQVSVRDHGPGLAPDQQKHVFEQFYRAEGITHQQGSQLGLGLGLYICRTIVTQHGGEVGVTGAPGEGSTFWFTLPTVIAD